MNKTELRDLVAAINKHDRVLKTPLFEVALDRVKTPQKDVYSISMLIDKNSAKLFILSLHEHYSTAVNLTPGKVRLPYNINTQDVGKLVTDMLDYFENQGRKSYRHFLAAKKQKDGSLEHAIKKNQLPDNDDYSMFRASSYESPPVIWFKESKRAVANVVPYIYMPPMYMQQCRIGLRLVEVVYM